MTTPVPSTPTTTTAGSLGRHFVASLSDGVCTASETGQHDWVRSKGVALPTDPMKYPWHCQECSALWSGVADEWPPGFTGHLPPPDDPEPPVPSCVKCGGRKIKTRFQSPRQSHETRWLNGVRHYVDSPVIPEGVEYLLRQCEGCRFEWVEPCLDADVEPGPLTAVETAFMLDRLWKSGALFEFVLDEPPAGTTDLLEQCKTPYRLLSLLPSATAAEPEPSPVPMDGRCSECRHGLHSGVCLNMASDNDCICSVRA